MKNQLLFALFIMLTFLFSSCSTSKITSSTSKTMDIYGSGVIQKPVVVELEVKETKIVGSVVASSTSSPVQMKNDAVAQAIKKASADVLVEPKFESETLKGKTTVTVSGFPGFYTNFRPVQPADTLLLRIGILQKAEVHQPVVVVRKKSSGGAILGSVLVIGLLVGIAGYYGAR